MRLVAELARRKAPKVDACLATACGLRGGAEMAAAGR
jgi:hypothetical protein